MAETQNVKVVEQKMYSTSYIIGALILGLVVGSLLSFAWFKTDTKGSLAITGKNSASSTATTTNVPSDKNPSATPDIIINEGGILSIDDQPAGLKVEVAQAQVSSDQWVVIREAKNGQPANVLGAARFVGGATSGVVELLRTTQAGATYYGLVYKDNGDRAFSLTDDSTLLDSAGNPVLVSFTAR